MKAVIVEDEYIAAEALSALIGEVAPQIEVQAILQSIDESVEWFASHPAPDIVFMDIHLADGPSFAIFEQVDIACPIIFTTAYDEYALKAFEVNSVDYLLKPISREDMERAMKKLGSFASKPLAQSELSRLIAELKQSSGNYRSSLLVAVRDKLIPLSVSDIAYIYIDNKVVKAETFGGQSYVVDMNMEELGSVLNPASFFRANRQFLIARDAVKDISLWFGSKLAVNLTIATPERIYISKAKVKEFKNWITG